MQGTFQGRSFFVFLYLIPGLLTTLLAAKGPISYAELGQDLLGAHGLVIAGSGHTDEYGIPVLTTQEKRKMVISILAEHELTKPMVSHDHISDAVRAVIQDLDLFYVKDADNHANTLFSRIDQTQTLFGHVVLAKMVATPTHDINILNKRRALIEQLVSDDQLFAHLNDIVTRAKKVESPLLSLWLADDPAKKELIKGLYFNTMLTKGFNKNPRALELLTRSNNFWNLCWPLVGDVVMGSIVPFYSEMLKYESDMRKATGLEQVDIPYWIYIKNINYGLLQACSNLYNPFGAWKNVHDYSTAVHDQDLQKLFAKDALPNVKTWLIRYYKSCYLFFPLNMWGKWQAIKNVRNNFNLFKTTITQMQAQLIGASAFMQAVDDLAACAQQNPIIAAGLANIGNADSVHDVTTEDGRSCNYLLKLLQKPTFQGEPSFFSYTGRILLTHRLMKKHKLKCSGLMELIGELDACLSVARLIKQFKDTKVHYSLVTYENQEQSHAILERVWNPLIDADVVVPNTVELGGAHKERVMILTGSNTGGKSTLLKSILFSVLLAQTLCIAPADGMSLTPYVYIGSSLNIVDNTAAGKSLYQAEVDRAAALIASAQHFQGIGHTMLIIDELFRGTSPDRAQQETYTCAQQLAKFADTHLILATHYTQYVTTLEKEMAGICKNYKMEVKVADDGTKIHTYQLEEGVNTVNIAADLLDDALKKAGKQLADDTDNQDENETE